MVPHGLVNIGTETLKVVGFFSESEIISSFDEPVQPFGIAVLNQGAPAPVPAEPPSGWKSTHFPATKPDGTRARPASPSEIWMRPAGKPVSLAPAARRFRA